MISPGTTAPDWLGCYVRATWMSCMRVPKVTI